MTVTELLTHNFEEELAQQINGTFPAEHIYELGTPSEILLSIGFPNMPIAMSSTILQECASNTDNPFDLKEIQRLVDAIQMPMSVYRYSEIPKSQGLILNVILNDKRFLVGVHFHCMHDGGEVNIVSEIFPIINSEWLTWIAQGKAEYLDKKKIQDLLSKQRTNSADVAYLDLDFIAKVIKNFENPISI